MTETCGIISIENPREGTRLSGSTGILVPGVESQIVSVDKLEPLSPNQLGEICLRGSNMMQGRVLLGCFSFIFSGFGDNISSFSLEIDELPQI